MCVFLIYNWWQQYLLDKFVFPLAPNVSPDFMDVLLIKKRKEKRRKDSDYLWESLFQKNLEERKIQSSCL